MTDDKSIEITGITASDFLGAGKLGSKIWESLDKAGCGIFKPNQIRRVARAEADAKRISAMGDADATDTIESRAIERHNAFESKRQANLEQIVSKAAQIEPGEISDEQVDPDWLIRFIDDAKDTSNEEMQELWARLLAGEVAKPGSFSKKTISIVKDLDTYSAQLFSKVCNCGFGQNKLTIFIHGYKNVFYKQNGLNYSTISNLESIGLLTFHTGFGLIRTPARLKAGEIAEFKDKNGTLSIHPMKEPFKEGLNEIPASNVTLTCFGQELAKVVERTLSNDYIESLIESFALWGYVATFEKTDQ